MSYAKSLILRNSSEVVAPIIIIVAFESLEVTLEFHYSICNSLYEMIDNIEEHCIKTHE